MLEQEPSGKLPLVVQVWRTQEGAVLVGAPVLRASREGRRGYSIIMFQNNLNAPSSGLSENKQRFKYLPITVIQGITRN